MEVRQIVRLCGSHTAVLADVALLLEFLENLPTAELIDESAEARTAPPAEWPSYNRRLLRYNGREATITPVYDKVFRPLWEARGDVVSTETLTTAFGESADPRQRVAETIHRLRDQFKNDMPELTILTAGDGYYLRVAA